MPLTRRLQQSTGAATITIYDAPSSIPSHGESDAAPALATWLSSLPPAAHARLRSDGQYHLDTTLLLSDIDGLTLDGNGSELHCTVTSDISTKPDRPLIRLMGGHDVTLRNFTVSGTSTTPVRGSEGYQREWQWGINIKGTQHVLVENVNGHGLWGDFVGISPDTRPSTAVMADDVTVQNCSADITGRNMISFGGCTNITIQNCTFNDCGYQVFDLEVQSDQWVGQNIHILNNDITGYIPLSVLSVAGTPLDVSDIYFVGNRVLTAPISSERPVSVYANGTHNNFVITDNYLWTLASASQVAGITGLDYSRNVIRANDVGSTKKDIMLRIAGCDTVTIHDNKAMKPMTSVIPDPATQVTNTDISGNQLNLNLADLNWPASP